MIRSCALAAALAVALLAHPAAAAPVRTGDGLLEGIRQGDVVVYKGVPFAAPPTGELRWRPPQPVKPWKGIRRADAWGPGCMQKLGPPPTGGGPFSEDCLYLNVWRPAKTKGPLPVMLWFYGGGFASGSAAWDLFDASALARHGVMVVTFNYRLGPLGFLAHPELTKESGHVASGNYGLMDCIAALQWIRSNAAALGGDPSRVTLFGQSAGAMLINDLLIAPQARGLFSGAIGESGGYFAPARAPWVRTSLPLFVAEKVGSDYAASLGAPTLAALRRLPADRFLAGDGAPIADGWLVTSDATQAFAAGRQADVPMLVGSNADEANFPRLRPPTKAAEAAVAIKRYFPEFSPRILTAYPFHTDEEAWRAWLDFDSDLFFGRWDIWSWARLQARTGKAPVFYYRFEEPEPLKDAELGRRIGAPHGSEMLFIFQNERLATWNWTPRARTVAEQMAEYWTDFAKTGDPNGPGLPSWPRFSEASPRVMRLKDGPEPGDLPNWRQLQFIDEMMASARPPGG